MKYKALFLYHPSAEADKTLQYMKQVDLLIKSSVIDDFPMADSLEWQPLIIIIQSQKDAACIPLCKNLSETYPEALFVLILDHYRAEIVKDFIETTAGHYLFENQLELLPSIIKKFLEKQQIKIQREEDTQKQNQALVTLATRPALARGDWDEASRDITRIASETMSVSRVSIWLYNETYSSITCKMLYKLDSGEYESSAELKAEDYPAYFETLKLNRVIVANDAHKHPATCEFSESYLKPLNIQSMLDAPIRLRGAMIGVVCHEQIGQIRNWSLDDQHFAAAVADLVSHTIENYEHYQMQDALRQSETYLRQAESIAHLGNFSFNTQTQEIIWSDEVYHIFGQKIGTKITLERYQSLLAPEDFERVMTAVNHAVTNKQNYEIEHDIVLDDGTRKHLFARARPVLDANGNVFKVFGIIQDISERIDAEQQKIELKLNIEKLYFLRDFVEHMTHDLKTPLAGLKATSYLLQKIHDPIKQQEQIHRLDDQVNYLEKIIDDILAVARLDHLPKLSFEEVQLNQFIEEITQQVHAKALHKELRFQLDLAQNLPLITAAPDEMRRAILNLVENALNYTPKGGLITIRTYATESRVVFEIEDTGIGINSEDLPHIFEQFYRTDNARSFDNGTGLGLSIVHKVVQLHDGDIQVHSVLGKGTKFIVQFWG